MAEGSQHPPVRTYLLVAAILSVITAVEVSVYYITVFARFLAPVLIVLSAAKFSLVAMFFMHLKSDHRAFAGLFVGPLLVAVLITLALMALFGAFAVALR